MIVQELEQVCSILGDLASECQSLIQQYGGTVLDALAKALVSTGLRKSTAYWVTLPANVSLLHCSIIRQFLIKYFWTDCGQQIFSSQHGGIYTANILT